MNQDINDIETLDIFPTYKRLSIDEKMQDIPKYTQMKKHRSYSSEEVKQHSTEGDLWMIIYNKVYDLTKFVDLHPGGGEVMLDCAGVDASEAFEDVGHSDDALDMLEPYFVGELIKTEHKPYQTPRAKFLEAEKKVKQLRFERALVAKQRRRKKYFKKMVERFTIIILVLTLLGTILFYVSLQKAKWNYYTS